MDIYQKCVNECHKIFLTVDYRNDWCAGEEQCRKAVKKISKGKVSYFKPMTEALRNLGVDVQENKMDKRLCTVKLFFVGYCMDIDIYLDIDDSIEEQVFEKYESFGLKDFKWIEKDYKGEK